MISYLSHLKINCKIPKFRTKIIGFDVTMSEYFELLQREEWKSKRKEILIRDQINVLYVRIITSLINIEFLIVFLVRIQVEK
jgi:hypothetical protein